MNKAQLIRWLVEEQEKWALLMAAIGEERMAQSGVSGHWSMRDIIAHLSGWEHWTVTRMQAAADGRPKPVPPWPADFASDDPINAWIYDSYRALSLREVLEDAAAVHRDLLAVLERLPEDSRIETIEGKFHVIWVKDQRFAVGEFFYHFYDDHAADVQRWLSGGA